MNNLYLAHHGIKGQKWGIRRFQNEDGSVTLAGAERYYVGGRNAAGIHGGDTKTSNKRASSAQASSKKSKAKKIIAITAAVAVTAVVAYAGYKYVKNHPEKIAGIHKKLSEITGKPLGNVPAKFEESIPKVRDKTAEYAEAIKKAGLDSRDDRSKEYAEIAKMAAQQSKVRDKTAEYAEAIKKAGLDSNKFERVYRKDAAGNLRSLDLPIDKNGYARDFAKRMSKSSSNPQRDYEYWFKYMMSKYKYQ